MVQIVVHSNFKLFNYKVIVEKGTLLINFHFIFRQLLQNGYDSKSLLDELKINCSYFEQLNTIKIKVLTFEYFQFTLCVTIVDYLKYLKANTECRTYSSTAQIRLQNRKFIFFILFLSLKFSNLIAYFILIVASVMRCDAKQKSMSKCFRTIFHSYFAYVM